MPPAEAADLRSEPGLQAPADSPAIEVITTSGSPQATTQENGLEVDVDVHGEAVGGDPA